MSQLPDVDEPLPSDTPVPVEPGNLPPDEEPLDLMALDSIISDRQVQF